MPELALTSLLLDVMNPRFVTEQENQKAAIRNMAAEQGEKLLNLAEDIVRFGIDPSSSAIIVPDPESALTRIVVEGNRRVAALKLLQNPELLQSAWEKSQERRLKALSEEFKKAPINSVTCVEVPDREAANHWIQLRHRGAQEGRGIVSWDGLAAARYEQRRGGGRAHAALQAIDLVRQHGNLDQHVLERLGDVPVTTVQRLLNDPEARSRLGLDFKKGQLMTQLPEREAVKGLTRIIRDAALGDLKVSRIETKQDRVKYLDSFKEHELPATTTQRGTSHIIAAAPPPIRGRKPANVIHPSKRRATVIPQAFRISIAERKPNDMFHELRHMKLDDFPIAISVLFRVFLELSVDHYVTSKNLMTKKDFHGAKLSQKIIKVAEHLVSSGTMNNREVRTLHHIVNPQHFLAASIDTLHGYLHDAHLSAGPTDLIAAWNSLEPFFEKFWQ